MNDTPRLTVQVFRTLLADTNGPCVSLYLPTHRRPAETRQDVIHLKNLLAEAERELAQFDGAEVDAILAPARALVDDRAFWQSQREGLAVLLTAASASFHRLPFPVEPRVTVAPRLHLKPLLPLVTGDGRFFVLSLSQNAVRLFEGTRYSLDPVDASALPDSLAEALQADTPERVLQHHASSGRGTAIFHGHGANEANAKDDLLRFFRQVDKGLVEHLTGQRAPLVLAGVDYYFPIYRDANTYGNLMAEGIPGNPEHESETDLHARAWAIVEGSFDEARRQALDAYGTRAGTGTTSRQVREILQAAAQGRIETLFVAADAAVWGPLPGDMNDQATIHERREPGDVDFLDIAACETVRNGGQAYAVPGDDIPARSPAAAVFRY